MEKGLKISKTKPAEKSRDYDYLLAEGKKYLESLTGYIWNDFNVHDPGITILELLCYAITDLGHRCNHPIKDIIEYTSDDSGSSNALFPAEKILPNDPFTINDLRKLLIDIKIINGKGINNAWFVEHGKSIYVNPYESILLNTKPTGGSEIHEISIKGLYDVKLEIDKNITKTEDVQQLIKAARAVLNANRNLCEVFVDINVVEQQEFIICAEIDIEADADKDEIEANIFYKVQNYLTPQMRFWSFKEMLKKGYSIDEIFEGPLLENGFIDDEDLKSSELRTEIRLSDIINIIMNIKGVKAIKEILVNDIETGAAVTDKWLLDVTGNRQPIINLNKSAIKYLREYIPLKASKVKVRQYMKQLEESHGYPGTKGLTVVPDFENREIGTYRTLQNHFPLNYGIGETGLPESASSERKAQANQLKAYLLFFDQVLANYLAQLSHVKKLFSLSGAVKHTYYINKVLALEGIEGLVSNKNGYEKTLQELIEDKKTFWTRRNKFINHLLARFAENFSEYVNTLYSCMDNFDEQDVLESKLNYLCEYPQLSAMRGKGIDFTDIKNIWNTNNVSGLMKRVSRLVGIKNYYRRDLIKVLSYNYQEIDTKVVEDATTGRKKRIKADDKIDEFRFRIIDDDRSKVLLSSSAKYLRKENASAELERVLTLALEDKNYQLKQTKDGRYYFNILDENEEIVARRIEYFETQEARQEAIDYLKNFLAIKIDDEGFFILEHILLLPRRKIDDFLPICVDPSCKNCADADPYSFRITIILPAWAERFKNMDFRKFVEKTIRLETPAHILPRICWVDQKSMSKFEKCYKDWLKYFVTGKGKRGVNFVDQLVKTLSQMKSVYPEARIFERGSKSKEPPFILDRTNLGTN